jgi:hypothetical protein
MNATIIIDGGFKKQYQTSGKRQEEDPSNLYWLFFLFGASDSHAGREYTVMRCACLGKSASNLFSATKPKKVYILGVLGETTAAE